MYSRSNNNFGVNTSVSIDPSSSSQTSQSITNNIIVRAATGEDNLPLVERSIEITDNKSEQEIQEEKLRFDDILLDVYKSILLTQNKVLLTNILSKKHIIIYKTDLENVIGSKINKKCAVVLKEDPECGCIAKNNNFAVIDSIVIYEENKRVDFKVAFNSDYVELGEKYGLSLKVCVLCNSCIFIFSVMNIGDFKITGSYMKSTSCILIVLAASALTIILSPFLSEINGNPDFKNVLIL